MVRPKCAELDPSPYLTIWPILGFSFFLAVDIIVPERTFEESPAVLRAAAIVLVTAVHTLALSVLTLALADAYVSYERRAEHLCSRSLYLEANTAVACGSLLLASLLACFQDFADAAAAPLPVGAVAACRLVPWTVIAVVTAVQVAVVLRTPAPAPAPARPRGAARA